MWRAELCSGAGLHGLRAAASGTCTALAARSALEPSGGVAAACCPADGGVCVSACVGLLPRGCCSAPLAIVDKRRSAHNVSEVMNLIGDVKGKVRRGGSRRGRAGGQEDEGRAERGHGAGSCRTVCMATEEGGLARRRWRRGPGGSVVTAGSWAACWRVCLFRLVVQLR